MKSQNLKIETDFLVLPVQFFIACRRVEGQGVMGKGRKDGRKEERKEGKKEVRKKEKNEGSMLFSKSNQVWVLIMISQEIQLHNLNLSFLPYYSRLNSYNHENMS
jgi:hypothetical protein